MNGRLPAPRRPEPGLQPGPQAILQHRPQPDPQAILQHNLQPGLRALRRSRARVRVPWWWGGALVLLLAACAGGPPPPQWRLDATSALDRAAAAYLSGDSRREAGEFALARERVARTGRPALLARIELMRCATRVASLEFGRCEGFEPLRADADPPERAYAAHLAAQALAADDQERLPAAQRVPARALAGGEATLAGLQSIDDPLARLIAVAVLFQAGKASPAMIGLAVDTASEQGWRRPLIAWLQVLALRAERAGDADEAARLRRRIDAATGAR